MVVKTNNKKNVKKMLATGMLVAGMVALTACNRKETNASIPLAVDVNTVAYSTERENCNNILATEEDKNDKKDNVVITYEDNILTLENDNNKVRLDGDGIHVMDGKESVDVTQGGVSIVDGDSKVEVNLSGIHIKDGKQGSSININLPAIQITNGETGDTVSLSKFLDEHINGGNADLEKSYDRLDFYSIDKLNLLDNTINVNGQKKHRCIFLQDGYLVIKNFEEKSTTVKGLTLEKCETDKTGNKYRYYKK